jgi:thioredoxin-like negative regulator of GroEL
MDAEELYQEAKKAYAEGDGARAYKLANMSYQRQESERALDLKARAACRMKNKPAAKAVFDDLPRERRRDVRKACRDDGVSLGL